MDSSTRTVEAELVCVVSFKGTHLGLHVAQGSNIDMCYPERKTRRAEGGRQCSQVTYIGRTADQPRCLAASDTSPSPGGALPTW